MSSEPMTAEPQPGDERRFIFTAVGGEAITVSAQAMTSDDGTASYTVTRADASKILNAWVDADYPHRWWHWSRGEVGRSEATFTYTAPKRTVFVSSWPESDEANRFSLSALRARMPGDHYTLERAEEPRP